MARLRCFYANNNYHIPSLCLSVLIALAIISYSAVRTIQTSTQVSASQEISSLTVVNAASGKTEVAPNSIALGTGSDLAPEKQEARENPLTTLGDTSVKLKAKDSSGEGELCQLFSVSPEKIEFLIPAGMPTGEATITVLVKDVAKAEGTVTIRNAAPGIFTLEDGKTPEADVIGVDGSSHRLGKEEAIEFPPEGGEPSLRLNLTGLGAANEIKVLLDETPLEMNREERTPQGKDPIKVKLPPSFAEQITENKPYFNLQVIAQESPSNVVQVRLAPLGPLVKGFPDTPMLVGAEMNIEGNRFAPNHRVEVTGPGENNLPTLLKSFSPERLKVQIPYGAVTGPLTIKTSKEIKSKEPLNIQSSISGFFEVSQNQNNKDLGGVIISLANYPNINTLTDSNGSFVLPLETYSPSQNGEVIYAKFDFSKANYAPYRGIGEPPLRISVLPNRDNQFAEAKIFANVEEGVELTLRSRQPLPKATLVLNLVSLQTATSVQQPSPTLEASIPAGTVTFELPDNATGTCPGNAPACQLSLTRVPNSRTPVDLPVRHFNTTIIQITPFGATFDGGKLIFTNTDNFPINSKPRLYKLETDRAKPSLGTFVDAGPAKVSADGQRVETEDGAIKEGSFYFVSIPRDTATITGTVTESDGLRPVRRAIVWARGQSVFTDNKGHFSLLNVPVITPGGQNDTVTVEVRYQRPNGKVERISRAGIPINANQTKNIEAPLLLPPQIENRAPKILAPDRFATIEGQTQSFDFFVDEQDRDPDPNAPPDKSEAIDVKVEGDFATLTSKGNNLYSINVTNPPFGNYTLKVTAKDKQGGVATKTISLSVLRASTTTPIAKSQTVILQQGKSAEITLTGSNEPGLQFVRQKPPTHGSLSGTEPILTYTPAANFTGVDHFTFTARKGVAVSAEATVWLIVQPVNHRPTLLLPETKPAIAGQPLNLTVNALDEDAGQTLTMTAKSLPPGATLNQLSATSYQFNWIPTFAQAGTYTIPLTVVDNGLPPLSSAEQSLTINVVSKWAKTSGPPGGNAGRVFSYENFVVASGAQAHKPYLSTDNAATWTELDIPIIEIEAFTGSGTTLLLASGEAIYGSKNSGKTWRQLTGTGGNITALAMIDSAYYAASYFGGINGIYRSMNGGSSWELKGLSGQAISSLVVKERKLFASVSSQDNLGVYVSEDLGESWARRSNGLPGNLVYSLCVIGNRIFAGTNTGLYISENEGQSWEPRNSPANPLQRIVTDGTTLYAQGPSFVYRSEDWGGHWEQITLGRAGLNSSTVAANSKYVFLGAGFKGVWRSADRGKTGIPMNAGIYQNPIRSSARSKAQIITGGHGAIHVSADNGQSWETISIPSPK